MLSANPTPYLISRSHTEGPHRVARATRERSLGVIRNADSADDAVGELACLCGLSPRRAQSLLEMSLGEYLIGPGRTAECAGSAEQVLIEGEV